MSKIILPSGLEVATTAIYTSGQGRISFYPENVTDLSPFKEATSFTFEDEDGNQTKYENMVYAEAIDIKSEVEEIETNAESTESQIATLKITYRVMTSLEKKIAALEASQAEQDSAIIELAGLLA